MINNLIHYILSSPDSIGLGIILGLSVFIVLGVITFILMYLDLDTTSDVTTILAFISLIILPITPMIVDSNSTKEIKYGNWKEIYTNDLNADVKLRSRAGSLQLTAGESINTDPKNLDKEWITKLTIQKDDTKLERKVNLNKDSFIKNGPITKNSKIVKVEYRTIEGYTKSAFDQTGDFIELKDEGQVRITIEPSDDEKKLNELLQ